MFGKQFGFSLSLSHSVFSKVIYSGLGGVLSPCCGGAIVSAKRIYRWADSSSSCTSDNESFISAALLDSKDRNYGFHLRQLIDHLLPRENKIESSYHIFLVNAINTLPTTRYEIMHTNPYVYIWMFFIKCFHKVFFETWHCLTKMFQVKLMEF